MSFIETDKASINPIDDFRMNKDVDQLDTIHSNGERKIFELKKQIQSEINANSLNLANSMNLPKKFNVSSSKTCNRRNDNNKSDSSEENNNIRNTSIGISNKIQAMIKEIKELEESNPSSSNNAHKENYGHHTNTNLNTQMNGKKPNNYNQIQSVSVKQNPNLSTHGNKEEVRRQYLNTYMPSKNLSDFKAKILLKNPEAIHNPNTQNNPNSSNSINLNQFGSHMYSNSVANHTEPDNDKVDHMVSLNSNILRIIKNPNSTIAERTKNKLNNILNASIEGDEKYHNFQKEKNLLAMKIAKKESVERPTNVSTNKTSVDIKKYEILSILNPINKKNKSTKGILSKGIFAAAKAKDGIPPSNPKKVISNSTSTSTSISAAPKKYGFDQEDFFKKLDTKHDSVTKKIKKLLPGYHEPQKLKEKDVQSEKIKRLDQKFNRMFTN